MTPEKAYLIVATHKLRPIDYDIGDGDPCEMCGTPLRWSTQHRPHVSDDHADYCAMGRFGAYCALCTEVIRALAWSYDAGGVEYYKLGPRYTESAAGVRPDIDD